jgi:creatinine amidohydrolase
MQLGEQNWRDAGQQTHKVVVIPIGSLEQHGHHLPLLTDSLIGGEIARRAEAELGDDALFLPLLWIGASDHHRAFPGTVSLKNETYVRVLIEMLESLIEAGWRRIFLLNSHGGNIIPGQMATYDVQLRYYREIPDLWLAFTTWFEIAREQAAAIPDMTQDHVIHACEWETAMLLRLRPELVKLDALEGTRFEFDSAFYSPDFRGTSRVSVARTMDQLSPIGAFGYPELGTPEKGEALFHAAAQEVVAFVREFSQWTPYEKGSEDAQAQ